jgi:hypothetical protein
MPGEMLPQYVAFHQAFPCLSSAVASKSWCRVVPHVRTQRRDSSSAITHHALNTLCPTSHVWNTPAMSTAATHVWVESNPSRQALCVSR